MEENKNSVTGSPEAKNPELASAQALAEMSTKLKDLEAENKQLQEAKSKYYDAILNGGEISSEEEKHRTRQEIRSDLVKGVNNDINNLDYCKLVVELDDESRRTTGQSVFLPKGRNAIPTVEEYNTADKLNAVFKECIEEADNDPVRFNMALKSKMSKGR